MVSLKNYLLEQEISDASMDDVALEQAIAEFEVATALLECELKYEMIMENTDTPIENYDVFMENDLGDAFKGAGKAVGNFFSKFGKSVGRGAKGSAEAVANGAVDAAKGVAKGATDAAKSVAGGSTSLGKGVANSVVDAGKDIGNAGAELGKDVADNAKKGANWFVKLWNTIITAIGNFFRSIFMVDFEKLIKKVEDNFDDDHKFEIKFINKNFAKWIDKMDGYTKDLLQIRQNYPYDKSHLSHHLKELEDFFEDIENDDKKTAGSTGGIYSKADFIAYIKNLNTKAKATYKTYGELKKALDLKNLDKDVDPDIVKMYKKIARLTVKGWSIGAKEAKKVINLAMGNATKDNPEADDTAEEKTTTESFEFEDIDSDTFSFMESDETIQENALDDKYNSAVDLDNTDDTIEEFDPVFEAQFDEIMDYIFQESGIDRDTRKENRGFMKDLKEIARFVNKASKFYNGKKTKSSNGVDDFMERVNITTMEKYSKCFDTIANNSNLPDNKHKDALKNASKEFKASVDSYKTETRGDKQPYDWFNTDSALSSNTKYVENNMKLYGYRRLVSNCNDCFKAAVKYLKSINRDVDFRDLYT